jgi:hypothetical protein
MKIRIGLIALCALVLPLAAHASATTKQNGDVTGWVEGVGPTSDVVGEASLVRNSNGITVTWHSTGLPPGQPVTLWWIVLGPDGPVSAQFAAGHVIGNGGVGNFGGHLSEGDTSGCFHAEFPCEGLTDAMTQTVIVLARTHGERDPGRLPEQIHSGETNFGNSGFEDDLCNPTFCQIQAAIFAGA